MKVLFIFSLYDSFVRLLPVIANLGLKHRLQYDFVSAAVNYIHLTDSQIHDLIASKLSLFVLKTNIVLPITDKPVYCNVNCCLRQKLEHHGPF